MKRIVSARSRVKAIDPPEAGTLAVRQGPVAQSGSAASVEPSQSLSFPSPHVYTASLSAAAGLTRGAPSSLDEPLLEPAEGVVVPPVLVGGDQHVVPESVEQFMGRKLGVPAVVHVDLVVLGDVDVGAGVVQVPHQGNREVTI